MENPVYHNDSDGIEIVVVSSARESPSVSSSSLAVCRHSNSNYKFYRNKAGFQDLHAESGGARQSSHISVSMLWVYGICSQKVYTGITSYLQYLLHDRLQTTSDIFIDNLLILFIEMDRSHFYNRIS